MMCNTIAVILPTYKGDHSDWLQEALESILNQTYTNFVIFVGVDGQLTNELDSVLEYYSHYSCIRIIRFANNRGLACVLNDLIQLASELGYLYFARMDADDRALPNRLENQYSFLLSNPSIDVVGGSINEIDELGKSRHKTIVYPSTPEDCRSFFARRNPHAHPAVMFRRSFFDKVGHFYRPEYRQNQDTMLWYDGMMAGTRHANLSEVVLEFRMTDSMFKKRRNGWAFAKKQFRDRLMINRGLGYGWKADVYGFAMFCILVSPVWLKRWAYKVFR